MSKGKLIMDSSDLEIRGVVNVGKKVLGTGSFAEVLEGEWGGTICAVKRLHRIAVTELYDSVVKKFMNECRTWSRLRHPNIVLFLGILIPSGEVLPSIIVEKMSTNLTQFAEDRDRNDFPLNQKAHILKQVALALLYIHQQSPPLLHRDLTPNNVLIDECSLTAKVTDFGLSSVYEPGRKSMMSVAPGTPAFMPPEAMQRDPVYDIKLDVFSFGNVVLYTLIHRWPEPDRPTDTVNGKLIAYSEAERRQGYLDEMTQVENRHFSQMIRDCLENEPKRRPETSEIVKKMKNICTALPQINGCNNKFSDNRNTVESTDQGAVENTSQLSETIKVLESKVTKSNEKVFELQINLTKTEEKLKATEKEKKMAVDKLEKVQEEYKRTRLIKRHSPPAYGSLSPNLAMSYGKGQAAYKGSLQDISRMRQSSTPGPSLFLPNVNWSHGPNLPVKMSLASAVVINGEVYVGGGFNGDTPGITEIYKLLSDLSQWIQLPPCDIPVSGFALAAVKGKLYTIGGEYLARKKGGKANSIISDKVQTYDLTSVPARWSVSLPTMKSPRYSAGAIGFDSYLVVAGGLGLGNEPLSTMEILNLDKRSPSWWKVGIPFRCPSRPQLASWRNDTLVLVGKSEADAPDSVQIYMRPFKDILESVLQRSRTPNPFSKSNGSGNDKWVEKKSLPRGVAIIGNGNKLYAVGGPKTKSPSCYSYNEDSNDWHAHQCSSCKNLRGRERAAGVVTDNKLIIIGGYDDASNGQKEPANFIDIGTLVQ